MSVADQTAETLRNIAQIIQADPLYYRHFGVYWWHMKRMLRAAGYNQSVSIAFGDEYPDHEALHKFDDLSDADFLVLALQEQLENAQNRWHSKWQADADGEEYLLHDPDVEV